MSHRCAICGDTLDRDRGARAGRCGTCTKYRSRNGTDRPDDLVIKQTQRDIERQHSKQATR